MESVSRSENNYWAW